MIGRPRKASDAEVFRAVASVINAVGPAGLTLEAVAREAGVTAPALVQRFGSKRNLLVAFARSGDVGPVFERARREFESPLAAIVGVLCRLSRGIRTREVLANNLAFLHMDLIDEDLRASAAHQARAIRRGLAELVDEALESGHLVEVDPRSLADTLYTIYNGALIGWAIDGEGPLEQWLTARIERVLDPHLSAGIGGP